MEGRCSRLARAILVVAVVAAAGVPAAAQQAWYGYRWCSSTQGVVSYCRNVLRSKYFTATMTCCIMAQHQPRECWCSIHHALAAAGYDYTVMNCLGLQCMPP